MPMSGHLKIASYSDDKDCSVRNDRRLYARRRLSVQAAGRFSYIYEIGAHSTRCKIYRELYNTTRCVPLACSTALGTLPPASRFTGVPL